MHKRRNNLILLLAAGSVALAASRLQAAGSQLSIEARAKEVFRAACRECHGGASPQAGVRVLDYDSLTENGLLAEGDPDRSHLFELITATDGNVMPPESRPPLTGEQIATVREWIAHGAKPFPADIASPSDADAATQHPADPLDDGSVLELILTHVRSSAAEDRPFYRYFSTRHHLRSGATEELLVHYRLALAKAINHLSFEADLVKPEPLDTVAGGTVFAIDIRRLGWHRRDVRPVDPEPAGSVADDLAINRFDLILLEYPYAIHQEDDPTAQAVAAEFLRVADQVRPIPFLRVDWFCGQILQPPLYHDLLRLPRSLEDLEEQLDVDSQGNLRDGLAQRAGMTVSGVSRNNRVVERHPQSNGYYWKSHDFATNRGTSNILVNPIDFSASGGEMIFRLPNGLQGYFVTNSRGERIDAAPTSIVTDKHASDRVVRNGLGCIRCHTGGLKDFRDVVRQVLDVLPSEPGFDKSKARRLYPGNERWGSMVKQDRGRFADAMERLGIDTQYVEPITTVSVDYLQNTVSVTLAAEELGLPAQKSTTGETLRDGAARLSAVCSAPGFSRLGLSAFVVGGAIRRDSWEDNFDAAVRSLGLGVPVVPINGVLRTEYLSDPLAEDIVLRTNKKNGVFEVGDTLRIFIENKSQREVHIDLFGIGATGKAVRLSGQGTKIAGGETFQFPAENKDAIEIKPGLGEETISLYASRSPLPTSTIFRGKNMDDRVVHDVYVLEADKNAANPALESDAAIIVKKSLVIETR